jgi:phenylpyruvate tautomerase PptA (4-oxalocrotonate tautomerase family)
MLAYASIEVSPRIRLKRQRRQTRHQESLMPLVRIDLQKGKDAAYRQKTGQIVYEAMVAHTGVPKNDHFQIIGEHAADNFIYDPDYAGIHRTDDLVFIQIFFNEGRKVEQKQALYKAIADGLATALKLRPEDVFINLVEVKKENWSFGNGIAQYAA